MPDKLSTFLTLFSAFQTTQLSSHPAGHPSQQPHALIAAYGDAMGLSMDWTKSRALCNPVLSPLRSHPLIPLDSREREREREGRRVYSFQFARVVHSTGDRKILGEGILFFFSSFASTLLPSALLRSSSTFNSTFPSTSMNTRRFFMAVHTGESLLPSANSYSQSLGKHNALNEPNGLLNS